MSQLGERLIEERRKKGVSLDELQEVTKIQKRYLKAIEEGNYDGLPGPFYVRAFVRQYADAIGLNGEDIVEEYKHELPMGVNEEFSSSLSRVSTAKSIDGKSNKIVEKLPGIIIGVVLIGAAVGIWYYLQGRDVPEKKNDNNNSIKTEVTTPKDSPLEKDKDKTETNKGKEETDTDKKEETDLKDEQKISVVSTSGKFSVLSLEQNDEFNLHLSATQDCYILIKSLNEVIFEGTLNSAMKEKDFDLGDKTEVQITVGYAPALSMTINEQKIEFPVNPNERTVQVITIQNKGITTP